MQQTITTLRKAGKDNTQLRLLLAGFNKKDVEVGFEDNLLTLKISKQKCNGENLKAFLKDCSIFYNCKKVNGAKDGLLTIACE